MNKKMLLLDRGNDMIGLAHEIMFYGYSDMHITSDIDSVYAIAQAYKPDLILLDLTSVNENIDFVWQRFQRDAEFKHTPVVIISGAYNRIISYDSDQLNQTFVKPVNNIDFATTLGYLMAS